MPSQSEERHDAEQQQAQRAPAPQERAQNAQGAPPPYSVRDPHPIRHFGNDPQLFEAVMNLYDYMVAHVWFRPRRAPVRSNRRPPIPGLRRNRGNLMTNMALNSVYREPRDMNSDIYSGYSIYNYDPNRDYTASTAAFDARARAGAYRGNNSRRRGNTHRRGNNSHRPQQPMRLSLRGGDDDSNSASDLFFDFFDLDEVSAGSSRTATAPPRRTLSPRTDLPSWFRPPSPESDEEEYTEVIPRSSGGSNAMEDGGWW